MPRSPGLFSSFFLAGFECSSHRRHDGVRLDLLEATGHARHAAADYRAAAAHGLRAARDGLRWHLIEASPGRYDWSSFRPMLLAARDAGTEVIWDLCHYGWPDHVEFWRPAFVDRFAAFCGAVAAFVRDETDAPPFYCPVNEISYWAWAGGDAARLNPMGVGRGLEVKLQLVRAALAGAAAIRAVDPRARIVATDPAIHVAPRPGRPEDGAPAEAYRRAQYEAWEMLLGVLWPTAGGHSGAFDIAGINFYDENQWFFEPPVGSGGPTIRRGEPAYRPFREILGEVHAILGRPVLVAETGTEGPGAPGWLRYVAGEVRAAMAAGVPVAGVCLYPITHYPGWANGRHCPTGLFGCPDAEGRRPVDAALAAELARQRAAFARPVEAGGPGIEAARVA